MARLVIFDVDGTILDSQDMIFGAIARVYADFGLPEPARAFALGGVGLSIEPAFLRLVGASGPWQAMAQRYRTVFAEIRADPRQQEPPFPRAVETIERLFARPDILLGIVTGKSRKGVRRLVDRFGWHGRFATVQTADDNPSKPDPSMVRRALAETGTAPDDAVLVGDTTFDMEMARGAGVAAIGVSWGYHERGLLEAAGANRIVDSFAELGALLLDGAAGEAAPHLPGA